jgi:23S rRNA (cytosine1962-C5)-methyltransferase
MIEMIPKRKSVVIAYDKTKSLRHRHPWVYSGAIRRVDPDVKPGDIVDLYSERSGYEATGYFNPQSKISVRVLTWNQSDDIDDEWIASRVLSAYEQRVRLGMDLARGACRLFSSESDRIPGLIVDVYAGFAVLQSGTLGVDRLLQPIVRALAQIPGIKGIFEKSDSEARSKEGLDPRQRHLDGDPVPDNLEILEGVCRFLCSPKRGHKTGLYLDQSCNRRLLERHVSSRDALDLFCYTGGFSIHALKGGARSTTSVDSSSEALEQMKENLRLNELTSRATILKGDVFSVTRELLRDNRRFDCIVCDPPKLSPTRRDMKRAMRAYKDLNLQCIRLLAPGGALVSFSCSQAVSPESFEEIIRWASIDAGRDVVIERRLLQSPDHPIVATFPESSYLKGIVGTCR